eukprot:scaffold138237_cov50-Attheya_sp.AAC.2
MAPPRKNTIRQCLLDLDVDDSSVFENSNNSREEEFKVLKKIYFQKVLKSHPDKGGDPVVFRKVQTSFELLRNLHNGGKGGAWLFIECMSKSTSAGKSAGNKTSEEDGDEEDEYDMTDYDVDFSNMPTPSWEYYEQAAEEAVPTYRVELAKTGRSKCKQKGTAKHCCDAHPGAPSVAAASATTSTLVDLVADEIIEKGEIRIGSINDDTGSYGRWCHVRCWRVPHKVWLGLPDPKECQDPHQFQSALASMNQVLLSGFSELPHVEKQYIVRHAMDRSNWAKERKKKKMISSTASPKPDTAASGTTVKEEDNNDPAAKAPTAESNGAVVTASRQRFVIPVPGQNGAQPNALAGKTFVLSGLFPEVGGGRGLSVGKDKAKALIVSFGGRVTGSVSGKTDVLVVGQQPGMSKVSKARASGKVLLMSLMDLKEGLDVGCTCLETFDVFARKEPMKIKDFSMGYKENGLVLTASKKDLAIAQQGLEQKKKRPVMSLENGATALDNGDDQKPAAKKRKPLSESKISNQSENQPVTTKKKASTATTKKAASKTTKKSAATTAKKPKKVIVAKPKKSIPKERVSVSSEKSTAIVVASTTRRSTRVRSAPKSLY